MEKENKDQKSASTCKHEYDTMSAEVEKAVDAMTLDASTDTGDKPEETREAEPAEGTPAEAPASEKGADGDEPFAVGDAEIERAVRAGLSIADARAFKDKGAFERVCAMLESKGGGEKISKDGEKTGGDAKAEDPFAFDVPEMTEDEEYDPKVVKLGAVVRKMGDALKSLGEENRSLRERLSKSEETEREREREAERSRKVEDRKNLRLARPGGERGSRREKSEDDILAEVAQEVASKFDI